MHPVRKDCERQKTVGRRKGKPGGTRTNQAQPDGILESHNGENGQADPQSRLRVQRQPEEALVGQVLGSRPAGVAAAVLGLKHPMRVPRPGVDFVPPPQPHEAPPRDVLQVVEIGGEEEDGDDED